LCKRSESNVFLLNSAYPLPLARAFQKKGLVVYHTFGTILYELLSSISGIINPFNYRKLFLYSMDIATETAFLRFADMLIVPHDKAAEEFRKIYGVKTEKIHVIPYGQDIYRRYHDADFFADVDAFRNKFAKKKLVLFVGGSEWNRKGAPYILQAFRAIKDKLPATLIMTGKPIAAHFSLAKSLGLRIGEDVLLAGLVDDRTLAKLYAACDVFSLPSLHEGFSQPVIEVMAYGKPVVVSPLAAYPTVEDGSEGFVIYPNDTNSYADALQKILTNRDVYAIMSKKAKLKAQKYSWDKIGLNLLKYLQQIVSNGT
jgi:glycosyltransferase involved in cell wall biosynthesis